LRKNENTGIQLGFGLGACGFRSIAEAFAACGERTHSDVAVDCGVNMRQRSGGLNQSADALVGHDFQQQGMFYSAVDDVY
jgi:hypothetical protein